MITDWNSPQGDFDPTEKQGELLIAATSLFSTDDKDNSNEGGGLW